MFFFFWRKNLSEGVCFRGLAPYSARSTIEGTAWASRYVLLCERGESAAKFTMNVSINTSWFRSKTPTEPSCRQSRPDRSSSASPGCVSYTCTGLQVGQFHVFCESVPRQNSFTRASCYSWSSKGNTSTTLWQKKIRSVPHFLKPPAIDNEPDSNAKMYYNQRAWRDGANLKAHIASQSEIPVRGRYFFRTQFSTTFRRRFCWN